MTALDLLSVALTLGLTLALALPVAGLLTAALSDDPPPWARALRTFDQGLLRRLGIDPDEDMGWARYAGSLVVFNLLGALFVYGVQRLQGALPFNPAGLGPVDPFVAWNTAISFASNTNWQAYGGETTMSDLTQGLALTSQNFLSAASGLAVLGALGRGMRRSDGRRLGNYWADTLRLTLWVLLPLSGALALLLVAGGVVSTLAGPLAHTLLEDDAGTRTLARGAAAAQVAIKQLGTNGGGFFNVNSAHPLENPSPWTNLLQLISILLLPMAQCLSFGALLGDRRQGWALLGAMTALFLPVLALTLWAEAGLPPALAALGPDAVAIDAPMGNLEGKELRFGVAQSGLWAVATTAASNGSVNAMHDSFTALGGLGPMWLMQLGEVVFGGVGVGLSGAVLYAALAAFLAGLMVGRGPELYGKALLPRDMKLVVIALLLPSATVLMGTALSVLRPEATGALANPGPHGFSELLYAWSSAGNNNGSAFGGLTASGPFLAVGLGIAMAIGRWGVIIPTLALAGAFAQKRRQAPGPGTLDTHTPLFAGLVAATILLMGALTFLPALALGPAAEHLSTGPEVSHVR
ncbi:MAG: potassium-transporting ATPase subunit KdpA [Deltaproteobacteria bacterium]|nr:potassium-transporting ATPase subunit KdpA [Deltaproteobacteria bacterium]